jgi:hypothetical protein
LVVEQEGDGVREDFAQQPTRQMPEVTCPHPLYPISLGELRKDGVYPVAKPTEQGAPFRMRVPFLGGVRSQKLHAHARQLLAGLRRMVVAIPDDETGTTLGEFGDDRELMGIGRGHRQTANDPRPADPHVHPEAIEGLFEERVFAEGGLSLEAFAAVGSGEQTSWQGEGVSQGEGGLVRGIDQELLPDEFLGLPEVCRLAREGGAMHSPEVREEVGVVTPEVGEELCIFVESQKLTDDLDGEDFGVAERGGGSACSEASEVGYAVVYKAKDGDDEGVKIQESEDLLVAWVGLAPPSVGRSRSLFNRSEKLAHGVS